MNYMSKKLAVDRRLYFQRKNVDNKYRSMNNYSKPVKLILIKVGTVVT